MKALAAPKISGATVIGGRRTFTLVHGLLLSGLIYGKIKPNTDLNPISIPILVSPIERSTPTVCRRETASLSRQRLVLAFSIRNSLDRVQQLTRTCELITGRGS